MNGCRNNYKELQPPAEGVGEREKDGYEYVLEVEPLVSVEEDVFEYLMVSYEKFAGVLAENIRLKWTLTAGRLVAYKRAHEMARTNKALEKSERHEGQLQ